MKAVWGKMDPHKRINTFEVRLKIVINIGLRSWLYVWRWIQTLFNWGEYKPMFGVILTITSEIDSEYAWEFV